MSRRLTKHVLPGKATRSDNIARSVYGLVLTAAVIAASSEEQGNIAGRVAAYTAVTLLVFWLAHTYAELLADWIDRRETPTLGRAWTIMSSEWALVSAAIPPLLVLVLGGAIPESSDRPAIDAALWLVLIELAAACGYAAHRAGARPPGVAAATGIGVLMAVLVIGLKTVVH